MSRSNSTARLAATCVVAVSVGAGACGPEHSPSDPVDVSLSALTRPAGNTGNGFFVSGNKIYDANGQEFRLRGVNNNHYWRDGGSTYIPSIAASRANAVRVVFGASAADGPNQNSTPDFRRQVVQQYINAGIVPVPVFFGSRAGLTDTTEAEGLCCDANDVCNPGCPASVAAFNATIDDWVGAGASAGAGDTQWVKDFERYLIINLANEWGPARSTIWRDAYAQVNATGQLTGGAIKRIRDAGIKALILIDTGDSGEDTDNFTQYAQAIENADPQHNVAFSIHTYSPFWRNPGDPEIGTYGFGQPYNTPNQLATLAGLSVPVIVGEFSSEPYNSAAFGRHLDPANVINASEANNLGWMAWMWYNNSDESLLVDNGSGDAPGSYPPSSNLTPFGQLVIEGTKGIKNLAQPATIFGSLPPGPTGLSTQVSGFGSSDNVIVRWTAVSGATSYKVYVGTSPGGEAATAAVTPAVAGASIPTQTGTYYYKVTAITAGGESARSAEVSATVLAAAPIPTNVVATPGNQQVTLTWTASPGAVRYDIARTILNGAQVAFSVTGTSFVDTGLVGGQTYLYLIGTANSQGRTSGQRTNASATPTGWTGVSLTAAPSTHTMNISFSAPPSMVPFPAGCNSTTTCAIGWRVSYGSRSGGETTSGSQFSSWIKSIGGSPITGAGSGTTVFAVVDAQIGGVWVRSAEASATMP